MNVPLRPLLAGLLLLLALAPALHAGAPDWLEAAARLPANAPADAPASVLLDETTVEIAADGSYTLLHRGALRLHRNSGNAYAGAGASYLSDAGKFLDATAWIIRGGRVAVSKSKREWTDAASAAPGALVDEGRLLLVDLSREAVADDVVGYETRTRDYLVVGQLSHTFPGGAVQISDAAQIARQVLPIQRESFTVTVPAGIVLEAHPFGRVPTPSVSPDRRTWSWLAGDRPFQPEEPLAPASAYRDGRLIINLVAAPGVRPLGLGSFSSWSEVGAFAEKLNQGQCDTSPELAATARKLTADCPDPLAMIRAVAGYVQKLRYVAINRGLSQGFGWRAHKASAVFAAGYGDCKDKVNLLRALLAEAGVKSHPLTALFDPAFDVDPDCPSPLQFNHQIIGIEVDASVDLPAVIPTEKWGRLLIFDPTDNVTALGDLPGLLQGTKVHLIASAGDQLLTLPEFSPRSGYRISRSIQLTLSPTGAATLHGEFQQYGQMAAELRTALRNAPRPIERHQLITARLADTWRNAVVKEQSSTDDPAADRCNLAFVCTHERFLQRLQGGTAVVKLDVLGRKHLPALSAPQRNLPLELPPLAVEDQITLQLPEGYLADELPAARNLETTYGSYTLRFESSGPTIVMHRLLVMPKKLIPTGEYGALQQFLSDIARADRTSVLLRPST